MAPSSPTATYTIEALVKAGGMGVVYRGVWHSPAGRRPVAIKRLRGARRAAAAFRQQLIAEAQLVFQLTHGNVCQVLDLGENADGVYVVMEYVEGCDLRGLLRGLAAKGMPLGADAAVFIGREIARALAYAHRKVTAHGDSLQLVHGDVTPANILLSVEGEVKLTDFGIARARGPADPGAEFVGGTPGFAAPEALAGRIEQSSDLYSLGATLIAALTGRPFRSATIEQLAKRRPDVSPELVRILVRATAEPVEERFLSAEDLEEALSVELGRRYSTFTSTRMAALVRLFSREPLPEGSRSGARGGPATTVVYSLTASGVERLPVRRDGATTADPLDPTAQGGATPATRTAAPPSGQRRRRLWVAAAAVAIGVGWLGARAVRPLPEEPDRAGGATEAASAPAPSLEGPSPPASDPSMALVVPAAAEHQGSGIEPGDRLEAELGQGPESPELQVARNVVRGRTTPRPSAPRERARPRGPGAVQGMRARSDGPDRAERGFLTVTSVPWGEVYVDGERVAAETPLYRFAVAPGSRAVQVFFPQSGRFSSKRVVPIEAGRQSSVGFRGP